MKMIYAILRRDLSLKNFLISASTILYIKYVNCIVFHKKKKENIKNEK